MTKQECKKIEFYLYNYNRINLLIKEREMQIIDSINVSSRSWIKSLKGIGNITENQVIKLIEDNLIKEYKQWKELIDNVLQEFRKCDKTKLKVIEYKFFCNIPEDIIANELYVSKTAVRTYINDIYFEIRLLASFNNLISNSIITS